jgi:putative ABC transport system permease protein
VAVGLEAAHGGAGEELAVRLELGPVLRTLRRQPAVLVMVVLEIAAGVATLTALLLSGSWYAELGRMHTKVDERELIIVSTYTPGDEATTTAAQAADLVKTRLVPGVAAASSVSVTILDDRWTYPSLFSGGGKREQIGWPVYTDPDIVATMGLKMLAGTLPAVGSNEVIATRCLAEELFGGVTEAMGKTFTSPDTGPLKVHAVVENVRMRIPFMPSTTCAALIMGAAPAGHEGRMLVRASLGERERVIARLPGALGDGVGGRWVDAVALDTEETNHHRIGHGLGGLLSFFGGLISVIALLGALAATSFLAAQRRRQIGIRRALGATKGDIVGYFLVENAVTMAIGSAIGLGGAALLFLVMRRFFMGLSVDLTVIGLALLLFWAATIAATLDPALRAARVPPSVASRGL